MTSRSTLGRTDFPDYDMLDAMSASALKKSFSSIACTSEKEHVSKSSALKNTTDSNEGDKMLASYTRFSVQLELLKRYKDSQI